MVALDLFRSVLSVNTDGLMLAGKLCVVVYPESGPSTFVSRMQWLSELCTSEV